MPALIVDEQLIVAKSGSPERQLTDGVYTEAGVFCNGDGSVVSQPSEYVSVENIPNGGAMPASRSPPPLIQPMKRRPGRPPGSTKKAKMMQQQRQMQHPQQQLQLQQQLPQQPVYVKPVPLRRGDAVADGDFTLRKFFEAGGRDYNDYLGWLKRKSIERRWVLNVAHFVPSVVECRFIVIVDPSSTLPFSSVSLNRLQNSDTYYCHLHRNVNLHYSRTFLPLCTSSPSPFSSSLPKGSVRLLHLGSLTLSVGLVT